MQWHSPGWARSLGPADPVGLVGLGQSAGLGGGKDAVSVLLRL